MHITRRAVAAVALAASALLAITACSSGTATADTDAGGKLTKVTLGAIPVADVGAIYLGVDQGYFKDEGIKLDVQFGQGGAALIPALMNGQYDIAFSGVVSALQAIERKLPIRGIAPVGYSSGEHGNDTTGIIVLPSSPIQDAGDLEGKTVAVNALKGFSEILVREAVIKAGGDPEKVKFVEVALPDMAAALENKQVDAISPAEPFLTISENAGNRLITSLPVDVDPDFLNGLYLVTPQTLKDRPKLVEGFDAALKRSFAYATEHPDKMRAAIGTYTEIDPKLLEQIGISRYLWVFPEKATLRQAAMVHRAGVLKDPDAATKELFEGVKSW